VRIEWPPRFIGKESNKLEEVEEGSVPDAGDVSTEYPNPRREREGWDRIVAKLKSMSKCERQELAKQAGLSPTTIEYARRGRMPHARNRVILANAIGEAAR
jgi:lambda repressor-like predicted transcriptional regulator